MPAAHTLITFARRVLDLSGRNKSLLLMGPQREQSIDLLDFDQALNAPAWRYIEQVLAGKDKIVLTEGMGQRLGTDNALHNRLKGLARKEKHIFEETGSRDLSLAWPMCEGRLADGQLVRAPLILWPMTLVQVGSQWVLQRREDDPVELNTVLLLAFSFYNGITLPETLLEHNFDFDWTDPTDFRNKLYNLLKESPLEVFFNPALYEDKLTPFLKIKREELEGRTENGRLKLLPQAVIGLFPQADPYLIDDLQELAKVSTLEGIFDARESMLDARKEGEIAAKSEEDRGELLPIIEPRNSSIELPPAYPLEADGSQLRVLHKLRAGQSLVVQGPPGTGKSQLISNLVADALARGHRVLVVCQKKAALDVVHRRLAGLGYGLFLGLIHDFRDDRKAFYQQVAGQLISRAGYLQKLKSLDSRVLAEQFEQTSKELARADDQLEKFRQALFASGEAGRSPKQLYLASNPRGARADMGKLYKHFIYPQAELSINRLVRIGQLRGHVVNLKPFWHERKSLAGQPVDTINALRHLLLTELPERVDAIAAHYSSVLPGLDFWQPVLALGEEPEFLAKLALVPELVSSDLITTSASQLVGTKQKPQRKRLKAALLSLAATAPWEIAYADDHVANAVKKLPLPDPGLLASLITQALQVRQQGWLAWQWWKLTNKGRKGLEALTGAELTEESLAEAERRYLAWGELVTFKALTGQILPDFALPAELPAGPTWRRVVKDLESSLKLASLLSSSNMPKGLRARYLSSANAAKSSAQALLTALTQMAQTWNTLTELLSEKQLLMLAEMATPLGLVQMPELWRNLDDHLDTVQQLDEAFANLTKEEGKWLELATQSEAYRQGATLANILPNSLALAWLEHIEQNLPELRLPAGQRLEQLRADVEPQEQRQRETAREIVLEELMRRSSASVVVERPARAWADLLHQVTKKRQLWPMRKLVHQFFEPISELCPCFLTSPETASAIFPLAKDLFDLVVFDEASQCFAERALPAAYRGKTLLITGDSKQLQPFNLYQVRFEDDADADDADTEALSWLDLAQRYLPQDLLEGHYRSRSAELIQFSNRHFYGNRLHTLPDFDVARRGLSALQFVPVAGQWNENTNAAEAEAVTAKVWELAMAGEHSIGVVTFNQPQQLLILDMLELQAMERNQNLPEDLFIKNIENVQGDEREVIIFSVGYAPSADGPMRMQFGSLSQIGGENRLNVAITRARSQIFVFASVTEADFRLTEASPAGARLLADFLAYARRLSHADAQVLSLLQHGDAPTPGLAQRLAGLDTTLKRAIPYADLTRFVNEQPESLAFTDDAAFELSPSAREYLIRRPAQARARGWRVEQFFSRSVWQGK